MSLVVVGSVAYDAIETPYGKRERALGGACTYIALSASYFVKPSIVAVVGEDFAGEDRLLLSSKGVDLEGLDWDSVGHVGVRLDADHRRRRHWADVAERTTRPAA